MHIEVNKKAYEHKWIQVDSYESRITDAYASTNKSYWTQVDASRFIKNPEIWTHIEVSKKSLWTQVDTSRFIMNPQMWTHIEVSKKGLQTQVDTSRFIMNPQMWTHIVVSQKKGCGHKLTQVDSL